MEDRKIEHDERFVTLLEAALGLPSNQRGAFLRSSCGSDPELLEALEQQLSCEERMGIFLLDPLVRRPVEHPFKPGDMIINRFRIVREVGEGGMGVIYEAMDERLEQRRALKCAKPGFQRRLPPEARAAMRVTHDNVCRIYEFHSTETEQGPIDFLCMEYIEGETLAERIRRLGPLEPEQAKGILRQLCLGVAAAHRDGVLHGDLKSNNVMLAQSRGAGMRAVIMDFGLARDATPGLEAVRFSSNLRGAPAYVAPELWRGEKRSVASDIYALGAIAYEMITGRHPFPPEAPIEKRLNELPAAPGTIVPKLGPEWDRVILKCLHPEPVERFSSAEQAMEALRPAERDKGRIWIGAGAAAAAVIAMAVYLVFFRAMAPLQEIRLSILPMQTTGCDSDGMKGVLYDVADRLRRLQQSNLVVIPAGFLSLNQVTEVKTAGARLGATHVLQTTTQCTGNKLVLTADIIDAKNLVKMREFSGEYSSDNLSTMSNALLGMVTSALKLALPPNREQVAPPAYLYYTQGMLLNQRDNRSADEAIPLFEKAIALDRDSSLPYAGLSQAYTIKYRATHDPQWLQRARQALDHAESRNPDSAMVHFQIGELSREAGWSDKAIESYHRAIQLQPTNWEFWDHLGYAYKAMHGRQADAVQAFQKAAELQPGYFGPHLDLGIFYFQTGNYAEAEAEFRHLLKLAPDSEAGNSDLCAIYVVTTRYPEAESVCGHAIELFPSAQAYNNLGASLAYQGKNKEALAQYQRAIELEPRTFESYSNAGDAYRRLNHAAEAVSAYQTGRDTADGILRQNPSNGYVRSVVAYFDARLNKPKDAESEIAQALLLSPENEQVRFMAVLTYEALHERKQSLALVSKEPPVMLRQFDRHPDLTDLRRDPQFQQLTAGIQTK